MSILSKGGWSGRDVDVAGCIWKNEGHVKNVERNGAVCGDAKEWEL
jgi:hypothetical protein